VIALSRAREAEKRTPQNFPAKPLDTRQPPVEIGIGAQLRVANPTTRNDDYVHQ
jgi:hypothetical protein